MNPIQMLETFIQHPTSGKKYDHLWPFILKKINDLDPAGDGTRRNELYSSLLNSKNMRIVEHVFNSMNTKSLDLMDTHSWIQFTINMLKQDDFSKTSAIYVYQMNVLSNCLYKNRVHDLLDIVFILISCQ